jgi:hypothetical protein
MPSRSPVHFSSSRGATATALSESPSGSVDSAGGVIASVAREEGALPAAGGAVALGADSVRGPQAAKKGSRRRANSEDFAPGPAMGFILVLYCAARFGSEAGEGVSPVTSDESSPIRPACRGREAAIVLEMNGGVW